VFPQLPDIGLLAKNIPMLIIDIHKVKIINVIIATIMILKFTIL